MTLKQQREAVAAAAATARRSHTHLVGRYKGKIPPGPLLDDTLALEAAVKTLRNLEKLAKQCQAPWTRKAKT